MTPLSESAWKSPAFGPRTPCPAPEPPETQSSSRPNLSSSPPNRRDLFGYQSTHCHNHYLLSKPQIWNKHRWTCLTNTIAWSCTGENHWFRKPFTRSAQRLYRSRHRASCPTQPRFRFESNPTASSLPPPHNSNHCRLRTHTTPPSRLFGQKKKSTEGSRLLGSFDVSVQWSKRRSKRVLRHRIEGGISHSRKTGERSSAVAHIEKEIKKEQEKRKNRREKRKEEKEKEEKGRKEGKKKKRKREGKKEKERKKKKKKEEEKEKKKRREGGKEKKKRRKRNGKGESSCFIFIYCNLVFIIVKEKKKERKEKKKRKKKGGSCLSSFFLLFYFLSLLFC